MNPLLHHLCRWTPRPPARPSTVPPAAVAQPQVAAACIAEPAAAGDVPAAEAVETRACGWFDSSLDLRQGLAVCEVRDPDWTVLVLWFGPAALRASAHLQ